MIDFIIGHWWCIQPPVPFPSPEVRGWDWKVQPSNHVVGSPGNQPQSSGSSKNHIITITRYLHCSQGNSGSSVQQIRPKTKYRYIYYKLQYHTMCLRDLSKLVLKDLFWIYQNFTHSPTVGHLDYFQLFTRTKNAAMNTPIHVLWGFWSILSTNSTVTLMWLTSQQTWIKEIIKLA